MARRCRRPGRWSTQRLGGAQSSDDTVRFTTCFGENGRGGFTAARCGAAASSGAALGAGVTGAASEGAGVTGVATTAGVTVAAGSASRTGARAAPGAVGVPPTVTAGGA
jgi:hypothetical protein